MDKYLGKRLDGRYEIREIIGVGGMAVVYKAYDNVENRLVAIKILKEEFLSNQEFLRRFKNESKAIAMLSHPNIVSVYDVSFGDLIQYIVMEYIEGITLKEFIEREGSLRWKDAVHFTIQILKGLQHAHDKGIVHRDVKPQNIMVLSDGTIKVTDFGIARFARSDQRTITDKAIGSVHYISPEQARGEKTDEKTDIYSVGVMLYEMLTGRLPFQAESAVSVAIMQLQRDPQLPSEINGSIPLGLEQITMHAMQKSQERRYQSASEILCDLTNFRKDPSITFAYTYFVDNSPTKFVGDINDQLLTEEEQPEEPAETKETNAIIPILTGVAVTMVVALIVLAIILIPKYFKTRTAEFECPKFVGMTVEEVEEKMDDYKDDFTFHFQKIESDEEPGVIVEQSIAVGRKIKKGKKTSITLYYSQDPAEITIPDVKGKTEAEAMTLLKNAGFNEDMIIKMYENHDEIEANLVTRCNPDDAARPDEKIELYISTGEEVVYVDIKDWAGEPLKQAKEDLTKLGLKFNVETVNITPSDNKMKADYVLRNDPSFTAVPTGSTVTLYVSTGMYETDFEIDLPTDLADETFTVSLFNGTSEVKKSGTITKGTAKFKFDDITSANEVQNFTVKINGTTSYMEITVNFREKSNNVTVNATYPVAPVEPPVSGTPEGETPPPSSGDPATGGEQT